MFWSINRNKSNNTLSMFWKGGQWSRHRDRNQRWSILKQSRLLLTSKEQPMAPSTYRQGNKLCPVSTHPLWKAMSHALTYQFSFSLNFMFNLPQPKERILFPATEDLVIKIAIWPSAAVRNLVVFHLWKKGSFLHPDKNRRKRKVSSTRISDIWDGEAEFDDIWPFLCQGETTVLLDIFASALSSPDLND